MSTQEKIDLIKGFLDSMGLLSNVSDHTTEHLISIYLSNIEKEL